MSNAFVQKNIKLSHDFDSYASRNPAIYHQIPNNSWVILTIKGDSHFNKQSRSIAYSPVIKKHKVVVAEKNGKKWHVKKFE